MQEKKQFFINAPKGLTGVLADELRGLGMEDARVTPAGVKARGGLEQAYRACLWSRVANRVLMPLAEFDAPDTDALYGAVFELPWEDFLEVEGTLAVDCNLVRSPIGHSRYAALRVKDAVCDRFLEREWRRPSVDVEDPGLRLNLLVRGRGATLSLDLSGGSLHRRGYRQPGAEAPLKENLAAGILYLAGWPEAARQGAALLDPMCGSGTLLIEGALMAADIAPGLVRRRLGSPGWLGHDLDLWRGLMAEAEARRRVGLEGLPPVLGYDRDPKAVALAREHVVRAGLEGRVEIRHRAVEAGPGPAQAPPGLLVVNPPYGERLGARSRLQGAYAALRAWLDQGWRAAVFTGAPELTAYLGRGSESEATLFNGSLECRLFRYGGGAQAMLPATDLINRLRKNLRVVGGWARREGVECYRLYDADLPDYALAVDLYQAQDLWVHVQEYAPPREVDPALARRRVQAALDALHEVLDVPMDRIVLKVRQRQRGSAQYQRVAREERFMVVREGAARLRVNLSDFLDTGLFLDHRPIRLRVGREAGAMHFLNLYAYTGAATVHAGLGGAASTTSVDLSRTYQDWAEANMRLNGLSGDRHRRVTEDVGRWLRRAAGGRQRYGLIFLDPPTFSNSKRMDGVLDVQQDHVRLIRDAARLLAPGGLLIFSTNYRRFKLDSGALEGLAVRDISPATIPRDFARQPRIHRCWEIRGGGGSAQTDQPAPASPWAGAQRRRARSR